LIRHLELNRN